MNLHLTDGEGCAIEFWPRYNEYGIRMLDGGTSIITIAYCPWCGKRLPVSRRDEIPLD